MRNILFALLGMFCLSSISFAADTFELCQTETGICFIVSQKPSGRVSPITIKQEDYNKLTKDQQLHLADNGAGFSPTTNNNYYNSLKANAKTEYHTEDEDLEEVSGISDEAWDAIFAGVVGCGGGALTCVGGTAAALESGGTALIFLKIFCGGVGAACVDARFKYLKWKRIQKAIERKEKGISVPRTTEVEPGRSRPLPRPAAGAPLGPQRVCNTYQVTGGGTPTGGTVWPKEEICGYI